MKQADLGLDIEQLIDRQCWLQVSGRELLDELPPDPGRGGISPGRREFRTGPVLEEGVTSVDEFITYLARSGRAL